MSETPQEKVPSEQPFAVRVRMQFTKQGPVRFLSHLDLLKCVERALRRSELPVAYTEGFHPRIRISFGPALALGHASVSEWMDVDMATEIDAESVCARLNRSLPAGLEVQSARVLPSGVRSLQASIQRACYRVQLDVSSPLDADVLRQRIEDVLRQQEIELKKKNRAVNLRAFIDDLRLAVERPMVLEVTLRVGPEGSVRPEDVIAALSPDGGVRAAFIERVALLAFSEGKWSAP